MIIITQQDQKNATQAFLGRSLATLFVFAILFTNFSVFAQQSIKFSGKILDSSSRSAVVGATVKLLNGTKTVTSDVEGKFVLDLKEDSKGELQISSLGYATKIITGIDPERDNGITIFLPVKASAMKEVIVRASSRKESVAALFSLQKNSSSIQDGISAESIRRSPDKNTGEVIRRVSGASVQDNKFVVIRGLNERYNVAMLNNSILPSTEPDKKAFSFDIIPSSAIENVIIYKTPTADLPGDFAGGLVKVLTKDYPAKRFTEVSLSTSANTLTTGQPFWGTYYQGALEPLGFFQTDRNLPVEYQKNRGASFITLPAATKQQITRQFPNTYKYVSYPNSLPNISLGINGGNTYVFKNQSKLGILYGVSYGNGRRVSQKERADYMINGDLLFDNTTANYEKKNNLSGLLNLAYAKGKNKLSLKGLFNNEFANNLGLRSGYDISNQPTRFEYKSYNSELSSTGLLSLVLEASHARNSNVIWDWSVSFTDAYKNQPDQKIISFRTPNDSKGGYYIRLGNENSPEIRNAGRIFSNLNEKIYNAGFNLTYFFTVNGVKQKVKLGTLNYYRDRNTVVDALGYASLDFRGVTINESKATNFSNLFSDANVNAYNLTLATIANNSTSYTAQGLLNAAYVLFDGKLSESLKLTTGVRAERYHQALQALNQETIDQQNLDLLPSALLTYSVGSKSNVRLAYSEAVNRPEFRELASYSVFDYDNFVVVRGNPDLKRALIRNADLRFESFPSNGEIFSFSVFYKNFQRPIEQVNAGNDVLTYQNAGGAITYGSEMEFRKRLDFIKGGFFENLYFYTNLSYMWGSVNFAGTTLNTPLQGQSPYLINSSLTYSNDRNFSLSVMYNRIGPRLKFRAVQGGAFNIFEMPRDLVDLQVSQKIMKGKAELKLALIDLFAQPFQWYYKFDLNPSRNKFESGKDKFINVANYGRSASFSIKLNL
ncbi:MAG: carboxypeptidase-like regulatory domain-containing protein [Chitinophagaceae bacterium]